MKLEVVPLWMVREGEDEGPAHMVTTGGFACGEDTGETTLAFDPSLCDDPEASRCPACVALFDELPIGPIIVDTETL
jgi:hypothetical protein